MKKQFWYGVLAGVSAMIVLVCIGISTHTLSVDMLRNKIDDGPIAKESSGDSSLSLSGKVANHIDLLQTYIDKYYLEEADEDKLADGILKGLVYGLGDPYSTYFNAEEYTSLMETSNGIYCGIGSTVSQDVKTGIITIVKPFVGGPAYEAGILPGDIIAKVDGEEVSGKDLTEVVSLMKGEEGSKVKIEAFRDNKEGLLTFEIIRRQIEIPTIEYEMLGNHIGYIVISEFDKVTAEQFRDALEKLDNQNMKGLVIDLRNNGGGLLAAVVDMLDRILPKGLIVYTEDKNGKDEEYRSTADEQFTKPLAVLINGNSASASEVFAGAVQDYKLGTLVGTKSFGKGIVQTILPIQEMQNGSAIKLTTSKYFTPNGRNIHGTGIEPDVTEELTEGLEKKAVILKEEDNQLQKALGIVKEKIGF